MEHKKLYTVLEVAHLLSVGKNTVYQLITDGKLEVIDFNGFKVRDVTLEASGDIDLNVKLLRVWLLKISSLFQDLEDYLQTQC